MRTEQHTDINSNFKLVAAACLLLLFACPIGSAYVAAKVQPDRMGVQGRVTRKIHFVKECSDRWIIYFEDCRDADAGCIENHVGVDEELYDRKDVGSPWP